MPKLDITGSSLNLDPTNPSRLDVLLQLANLSSLPNASDGILGGSYVDYLTQLELPHSRQHRGQATTHPKYLVYPGQKPIQSRVILRMA